MRLIFTICSIYLTSETLNEYYIGWEKIQKERPLYTRALTHDRIITGRSIIAYI